jgi:uncharacterized protein (TIGR00251 family)
VSVRELPDGVAIDLLVQPRASRERFGPVHDERIKLAVKAPPVDGAANEAVIKTLARIFGCKRSQVTITSGHSSRRKSVHIQGLTVDAVERQIDAG